MVLQLNASKWREVLEVQPGVPQWYKMREPSGTGLPPGGKRGLEGDLRAGDDDAEADPEAAAGVFTSLPSAGFAGVVGASDIVVSV